MPIWSTHTEIFLHLNADSSEVPAVACGLQQSAWVHGSSPCGSIAWWSPPSHGLDAKGWCHGDCKEDVAGKGWIITDLEVVKLGQLRLKQIICHIHSYPDSSVEQAECCDLHTLPFRSLLLWTSYLNYTEHDNDEACWSSVDRSNGRLMTERLCEELVEAGIVAWLKVLEIDVGNTIVGFHSSSIIINNPSQFS